MTREEALKVIDETVKKNDLVMFMKGTPEFPMCGFSGRVIEILKHFGKKPYGVNILENEMIRQTAKEYSQWPTFPQVYVKGEFIGGCDIVSEMAEKGELKKLLDEKLG